MERFHACTNKKTRTHKTRTLTHTRVHTLTYILTCVCSPADVDASSPVGAIDAAAAAAAAAAMPSPFARSARSLSKAWVCREGGGGPYKTIDAGEAYCVRLSVCMSVCVCVTHTIQQVRASAHLRFGKSLSWQ